MTRGKGNKFNPRRMNRTQRRFAKRSRSDFSGLNTRAPARPKTAQEAPWNSLVIQRRVTVLDNTAFNVNTQYIVDSLIAQLELPTTTQLSWRLLKVDIYDLSGRPFDARIYDYTRYAASASSPQQGQLATGLSVPARNGWSSTRLVFPKSVSSFANNGGASLVTWLTGTVASPIGIVSASSDTILLRMHVLWRPLQTSGTPVGFCDYANAHHVSFAVTPTTASLPDKPTEFPQEQHKRLGVARASPMRA